MHSSASRRDTRRQLCLAATLPSGAKVEIPAKCIFSDSYEKSSSGRRSTERSPRSLRCPTNLERRCENRPSAAAKPPGLQRASQSGLGFPTLHIHCEPVSRAAAVTGRSIAEGGSSPSASGLTSGRRGSAPFDGHHKDSFQPSPAALGRASPP